MTTMAIMAADAAHHGSALPFKMALIGVLGIGAQWLAWRLQRPAIVLMAIAGLIFGPLLGYLLGLGLPDWLLPHLENFRLDPINDFGDVYRPIIGLAVAIILFEGGLTLRFKDLQDATHAVGRMVLIAGPLAWLLGTVAAHYTLGVRWDFAAMIGGLFVVTGPTVIMPLLRQAHLKHRPANILKWEGIVNDPLGALFAVGAYEFIRLNMMNASILSVFGGLAFAIVLGTVLGIVSGYALAWAFREGHIPEYLKAPVVLVWVLMVYTFANMVGAETGLLAVTALGMTMANTKFASFVEMRRFKETIATLLVSGVFVILTATLTPEILTAMATDWRIWAFVAAMVLVVRPIAVMLSTLYSGLTIKEALLVSWIAPRGIVAVAVAGLFATELNALGRTDGTLFIPLAFALVFVTVVIAGFTIGPVSKMLGLASGDGGEGVLIVGANPWSLGLAKAIKEMGLSVLVADTNWRRLRGARQEGFDTYYGEVLSEQADYSLDHSKFTHIVAVSPNDAYNSLVCVEFAPELGRQHVFQVSGSDNIGGEDPESIAFHARGRIFGSRGRSFDQLTRDWWNGWRFRVTQLSDSYTLKQFMADRGKDVDVLMARRPDAGLAILEPGDMDRAKGAVVLSFGPPRTGGATMIEANQAEGLAGPVAPLPK